MTPTRTAAPGTDTLPAVLARDLDDGFADLVRRHATMLDSVASLVGGAPAADVLERAYRELRARGPERIAGLRPRAWLLTLLLRDVRPAPAGDAGDGPAASGFDPRLLARRVRELPRDERVAVVLRYVEGLPVAGIAEVTGCPADAVERRIAGGVHRLRRADDPGRTARDLREGLAGLRGGSPALPGWTVSRWTRTPGPDGGLFVAFSDRGVSYVRTVRSVGGDAGRFRDGFRSRFGRPVRPAGPEEPPDRFDLAGLTAVERDVLAAVRDIPPGRVRSYAWVAARIGRPGAARTVGRALARNPVPVLLPCHRVVRSDGRPGRHVLGAAVKAELLRAEGVDPARCPVLAPVRAVR